MPRVRRLAKRTSGPLEAVHLDVVLLGQVVANQKGRHVLALVALQLQHLAQLLVLNHGTVAAVLCT